MSEVVVPPASGSVDYMLPVGDYDLFVYVGCPWEMRLDGEPWPED